MTGYGAAAQEMDGCRVRVEIRSVNHRYLKLQVRLPSSLSHLEPAIEKIVRTRANRGAIAVNVRWDQDSLSASYRINTEVAQRYIGTLESAADSLGLGDAGLSTDGLLALPGVIETQPPEPDEDRTQAESDLILDCVKQAMESLDRARAEEGTHLKTILHSHLDELQTSLEEVQKRAPELPGEIRNRLRDRVKALIEDMGIEGDLDEGTLLREFCLIADKTDVREELDRLAAHIARAREILDGSGEIGKRADFLTQEMLREVNTIGSKASDTTVSHAVVDMKIVVERLKEQVQNVE